jgi:hypothetical protein
MQVRLGDVGEVMAGAEHRPGARQDDAGRVAAADAR